MTSPCRVLTLNTGSLTVKGAVFAIDATETLLASAQVEGIGLSDGHLRVTDAVGDIAAEQRVDGVDHVTAIAQLRRFAAVDPNHVPQALAAVDAIAHRYPNIAQIACFDTTFHRSMSPVAQRYPLPARFHDDGVRRYGFHGLSCEYVMTAIGRIDPTAASAGS